MMATKTTAEISQSVMARALRSFGACSLVQLQAVISELYGRSGGGEHSQLLGTGRKQGLPAGTSAAETLAAETLAAELGKRRQLTKL
jgi:hypothetical protein